MSQVVDQVWARLREESAALIQDEPLLAGYIYACVLNHQDFASSLSFILANKIADDVMPAMGIRELFDGAYDHGCQNIVECAATDIQAVVDRDPAVSSRLTILLYFKGFQAIQVHRLAHCLWIDGRKQLALLLQSRSSERFGVDIHPACRIGKGVMFDHATGIVVGETAVIEDNVSILQGVTLGGTGNESGDRHPKIRNGVMIGSGAKILGNIEVGQGAKVGANSVVLLPVPPQTTVVGVPAKPIGKPCCDGSSPAETMDQNFLKDSVNA